MKILSRVFMVSLVFLSLGTANLFASEQVIYTDMIENGDGRYIERNPTHDLWVSPIQTDLNGLSDVQTTNLTTTSYPYWFALTYNNEYNVKECGGVYGITLGTNQSYRCSGTGLGINEPRGGVVDSNSSDAYHSPIMDY